MDIWVLTEVVDGIITTSVHKSFGEAVDEVRHKYELNDRMSAYEDMEVEFELETEGYFTDGYITWQVDSFTLSD
jgi:hypothetical protein